MHEWFDRFAAGCGRFTGRPAMFLVAIVFVSAAVAGWISNDDRLMWGASLALSSLTILLLPILQATQNRDNAALHAKLDELIKTDAEARNALIGLENRTPEEIEEVRAAAEREISGPRDPPASSETP